MRICIDARCLMQGRRTGVEEYTLNLILNLLEIDKENDYVLFFNSWSSPNFDFSVFSKFPNITLRGLRIPNKLLNLSFWYLGWPHIDKLVGGADILFLPNIIFYGASKKTKLFLTIHDLSFDRYPQTFSFKRKMWHNFINPKKVCRRADKIIAMSQSTKNDIISFYNIRPKKIEMIHSAASNEFEVLGRNDQKLIKMKEKFRLPYKFILYLGTIEPRKNIIGLIRAFDALQMEAHEKGDEEILKYKLIIAGAKGWLGKVVFSERKKAIFRDHIQMMKFVPDKYKKYVYNLASVFVYPSFFEGFGFPPLEAMKCGVPVIVSNNSSLPEIVGNGGILIDPNKPDEIVKALKEIIKNRELREKLIEKGLEKSKEFDWKKTAENFLAVVYKTVN